MALIKFITHDGTEHEANVSVGDSIMSAAVDNGIEPMPAECGGACACGTCHCYIDEQWIDKVNQPESMENDMLEYVSEPKENSRLSCQIVMTDEIDGIVVHLPAEQY